MGSYFLPPVSKASPSFVSMPPSACLELVETFLGQSGARDPRPRTLQFRKGQSPTQIEAPGHPRPSSAPMLGGPVSPARCCLPDWRPRITKHTGDSCGRCSSQPCHHNGCSLLQSVESGNPGNQMTQLPGVCTCLREERL